MECDDKLCDDRKRLLDALFLRARCLAVLRIDGATLNTQPVCLLDNEKDLLSVFSSPGFENLNGKVIIVDESSVISAKTFKVLSQMGIKYRKEKL